VVWGKDARLASLVVYREHNSTGEYTIFDPPAAMRPVGSATWIFGYNYGRCIKWVKVPLRTSEDSKGGREGTVDRKEKKRDIGSSFAKDTS
jgi:hypothetical protein